MERHTSGTLWDKVTARTESAIGCGKLHRIPTRTETIEQDGIEFVVRLVDSIERKRIARLMQPSEANPFMPYDDDLYVADVSDTHVCLLNKFNVVEHHLLIVTREFESQDSLLTAADFEAMWLCLTEFDSLVFYNSGTIAGASQPHKHLQQVTVPIGAGPGRLPMDAAIARTNLQNRIGPVPTLPFLNALAETSDLAVARPTDAAVFTLELYREMLARLGCSPPSDSYNLLATRDWMLLVPRSVEKYRSISVNSLGFAGSLLVRDEDELGLVRDVGPLNVLKEVAVAHQH
ncbi:MAG: phosphorylase [Gemmatimonadota bacterium]|nr:MAG: phosphorylase [Gemmatimonadota bacterium]